MRTITQPMRLFIWRRSSIYCPVSLRIFHSPMLYIWILYNLAIHFWRSHCPFLLRLFHELVWKRNSFIITNGNRKMQPIWKRYCPFWHQIFHKAMLIQLVRHLKRDFPQSLHACFCHMRIHISLGELDRAIFQGVLVIYNVDGKLFSLIFLI
jgi:hypothetical protein